MTLSFQCICSLLCTQRSLFDHSVFRGVHFDTKILRKIYRVLGWQGVRSKIPEPEDRVSVAHLLKL